MSRVVAQLILCLGALLSLIMLTGWAETPVPPSSWSLVSNVPMIHPEDSEQRRQGTAPSIQTLVVTPDGIVYAGSFGMGLFRSADKGSSWESLNRGLTDPFILCLAVMPGEHVYAGTMRGGVYRLSLKGAKFSKLDKKE